MPINECTRGAGCRKNMVPPSVRNLPWDPSANAESDGQPAQLEDCTLVGRGGGGSRERGLSHKAYSRT